MKLHLKISALILTTGGYSACTCWKRNNRKAYPYLSAKSFGGLKTKSYLCTARTPKPLNDAQIGGRFIFIPIEERKKYGKTYKRNPDTVWGRRTAV